MGISRDFIGFHGVSWDFIGISWDLMGLMISFMHFLNRGFNHPNFGLMDVHGSLWCFIGIWFNQYKWGYQRDLASGALPVCYGLDGPFTSIMNIF